jgi:acyl-CoA synthetase (AMP-forming)/AMP-acid ligase II
MSPTKLKELRERFGNIFVQLYGSSEHVGVVSTLSKADHLPLADGSETHIASAGRVTPGAELLIMGRDGKPVPTGMDGEIWMRSRAIIPGYFSTCWTGSRTPSSATIAMSTPTRSKPASLRTRR